MPAQLWETAVSLGNWAAIFVLAPVKPTALRSNPAPSCFRCSAAFFRWCEHCEYCKPMARLQMPCPRKPAKRILTDAELVAVWRAAEQTGSHFGTIVKLLMLPGQRRGENRRPQGQLLF